MAEEDNDVLFTEPIYSHDPANRTHNPIPSPWQRRSSTPSFSSGAREHPSLVAQATRHRASDASRRTSSGISGSTLYENGPASSKYTSISGPSRNTSLRGSVDTQDALTNFAPIAVEYMQKEKEREARLAKHKPLAPALDRQLQHLKRAQTGPLWRHAFASWRSPLGTDSDQHKLKSLARFYFPYRSDVKVFITDFKEQCAQTYECRLPEISRYTTTKPSDVQVRWIHAPLGLGPLHSTIEDLFLHQGVAGRPFKNLGRAGWPYANVEVLNFWDRDQFQNMRDVYRFLQGNAELTKELNRECWKGFEPRKTDGKGLLDDLEWRTTHLGLANDWHTLPGYWEASNSDVPWQITEGLSMPNYGPLDGLQATLWQSDKQALHKHKFFGSAQLVRDMFRCFHRGDGFLLTLSGMRGVNYLDRHIKRHISESGDAIFDNDVASAIAFVRRQFTESGTQTWHRPSVEWLLVHLITEIGATPHIDRQGCNAPTIEGAYQEVIQQFKRRQYEHFDRKSPNEPAELIKDMLTCEEELRRITIMSQRREQAFKQLGMDVIDLEREDLEQGNRPEHENELSASEKVQTALQRATRQTQAFELLLDDIRMTLKSVYDLRSIQQRQGGIITEGQNRALVLITLVQLVFIPFTTLCGYWGMNLEDIRLSSWVQHDFWRVCASIVVTLALSCTVITVLYMAWQKQQSLRREYVKGAQLFTGPANDRLDDHAV
ncbi:MAG: hypothetical protein L6R38_003244 [Xanthoria sp. 2 TBL-2021]|nr:MAG: hypothetical protein L6R38_003244 [Xanthoria sp. 2 TBL-2021]